MDRSICSPRTPLTSYRIGGKPSRLAFLLTVVQATVGLTACDRRTWTGPLASAADSMFPLPPPEPCDTSSVDFGFDRVALPTRACQVVRGDTTFAILADSRGKVLILTKAVTVDPARQAAIHDSLQFAIGTLYEAPAICPQSDDRSVTEARIWKTLDRQIELKNVMDDQVVLELRVNHPGCHIGG
jgi:hypothetical protein